MSSADLELQKAIRARLLATPTVTRLVPADNILDRHARPAPDPSIILGESQSLNGDDIARLRQRVVVTLHLWKAEPSLAGVKAIAGAVRAAIHQNRLQLATGFHCADAYVSDMRFLRDPDGETSHGVVTLECLVVEEPWSPLRLGDKLLAWWSADRTDLITLSGQQVSSWRDAVHGYDMAQSVAGQRPLWSATSFGGSPGVTADGVDDCLTLDSQPFPTGADPVEIWAVCGQAALASDAGARDLFAYGGSGTFSRNLRRSVVSGVNRASIVAGDGTSGKHADGTSVDLSGRHLLRAIVGATASTIEVDQSGSIASVDSVPATTNLRARLFSSAGATTGNFWNGSARDILVTLPLGETEATELLAWALPRRSL